MNQIVRSLNEDLGEIQLYLMSFHGVSAVSAAFTMSLSNKSAKHIIPPKVCWCVFVRGPRWTVFHQT